MTARTQHGMKVLLLLIGAAPAAAADGSPVPHRARALFVAPGGSDQNPGTRELPYRTIQRAAEDAQPGTTVHVAPGTYTENVTTNRHGSAARRIRYVSDTRWGARLVGSGTEAAWTNRGDHTEIDGFDVSGSGRLGILNFGSHTRIAHNHVHDLKVTGGCTGNGGAGIDNANYEAVGGAIVGNVVHDIGVPGDCNGVHGIYVANRGGRVVDNIVYRASAFGIHLWHAARDATIAHNTVFANGSGRIGGGILAGAGDSPGGVVLENTRIINNIVYDNAGHSIVEYCNSGEHCIGANNVVANNLVYRNGRSVSLRAGVARGTIEADPQFLDYRPDGGGNYRLRNTSPAIGKGLPGLVDEAQAGERPRARQGRDDLGASQVPEHAH